MPPALTWFETIERDVLHAVTCRLHADWLSAILDVVQVWELGVAGLLAAVGVLAVRSRPRALRALFAAAVGAGLALALGTGLWHLVGRQRPVVVYEHVLRTPAELATCASRPEALALRSAGARAPAFPSHHALTAGVFAVVLTLAWRPLGLLGWAFALLVAWGRLHAGKHWPTDVLAGLAIGAVLGWLLWRLAPRLLAPTPLGRLIREPAPVAEGIRE